MRGEPDDIAKPENVGGRGTSNPILDINGSGTVDIEDMLVVLNAWGPRPLRQKSAFR
jgi:hypothetical protein